MTRSRIAGIALLTLVASAFSSPSTIKGRATIDKKMASAQATQKTMIQTALTLSTTDTATLAAKTSLTLSTATFSGLVAETRQGNKCLDGGVYYDDWTPSEAVNVGDACTGVSTLTK